MPRRVGITVPLALVWVWALVVGIYSSCSLLKKYPPFMFVPEIPSGLDAALTFAMALLIAFRVNRSYERWWEARKLWGTLVNVSRNLAIKIRHLHEPDAEQRQLSRQLIVAFCFSLKDHLRDEADLAKTPGFENDQAKPNHVPSYVVGRIYEMFNRWTADGKLSDQQLWVLDSEARIFMDVCGSCERIKTTLMPLSWRFITWQCITVYLLVLPWGLVEYFGLWTIPILVVVAYFLMAGEVIAHYIEEPFGEQEDHLDLDQICQTIDHSVSEVLRS